MTGRKRKTLKLAILAGALVVAGWLVLSEPFIRPAGLPEGMPLAAPQRCMAIFAVCMALWFTNLIPLAATGLLAIALLPLLKVLPESQAFSLFGNSAVFFMLGVFLLAGAMISTGLSKRVTLIALQRFDKSPARLVLGVTVSASFLTLWMPEHAVAAMMYPIVVEIVDTLQLTRQQLCQETLPGAGLGLDYRRCRHVSRRRASTTGAEPAQGNAPGNADRLPRVDGGGHAAGHRDDGVGGLDAPPSIPRRYRRYQAGDTHAR